MQLAISAKCQSNETNKTRSYVTRGVRKRTLRLPYKSYMDSITDKWIFIYPKSYGNSVALLFSGIHVGASCGLDDLIKH